MAKRASDCNTGFVQNLSPRKKSARGNNWYEFQLQTSESNSRRIVGFADGYYNRLLQLQKSRSPVKINFQAGKSDILDKQCNVIELENFDVHFPYKQMLSSSTVYSSKDIDIVSDAMCHRIT